MSLGTSIGNQLLYRYLFRHVELKFGKIQSSTTTNINNTLTTEFSEVDDNLESNNTSKRNHDNHNTILTSLSRAEYEIIISKFLKLQHFLSKQVNPLIVLRDSKEGLSNNNSSLDNNEEEEQQNKTIPHLQDIYNFIRDKLEDGFIDSLSEYYLLDENQVDKLWRFGLLEYILIGSMSAFQANRISSIIDEMVITATSTEQPVLDTNIETGSQKIDLNTTSVKNNLHENNLQIVDVKKIPTQIYVTPQFERESWGWQIEDDVLRKSKKD